MNDLSILIDLITEITSLKTNLSTKEMKGCFQNILNYAQNQKSLICKNIKPINDNVEILIPMTNSFRKRKIESDNVDTTNNKKRRKFSKLYKYENDSKNNDSEVNDYNDDDENDDVDDDNTLTDDFSLNQSDIESIPSDPDDYLYIEPVRRSRSKSKTNSKSSTPSHKSKNSDPPKIYSIDELQTMKNETVYNISFRNTSRKNSQLTYKTY